MVISVVVALRSGTPTLSCCFILIAGLLFPVSVVATMLFRPLWLSGLNHYRLAAPEESASKFLSGLFH